jgi:hypothetical protein
MDFQTIFSPNIGSEEVQKLNLDFMKKYQDFIQDYQSFIYMASIPLLALVSRLVFFDKKQFNLSEHFVINIYAYSQTSIVINIVYILSIWNGKLLFWVSTFSSVFLISYFSYVYKKTFDLTGKQIFLKLLLFLVIAGILYIGIIIILGIYLAVFTDTFANMKPAAQAMLFY